MATNGAGRSHARHTVGITGITVAVLIDQFPISAGSAPLERLRPGADWNRSAVDLAVTRQRIGDHVRAGRR